MAYREILTNKGIDKTLYKSAVLKSKFKIAINPLVIPQPKQETPKKVLSGHKDTEKIFVNIKRITKKTNPTPKECRVCLFLLLTSFALYQRLPIAISKTTGQN